jgi:hypothetical protein
VAPILPDGAAAEWASARCRALSQRGMSFVTDEAPTFSELLVALGEPDSPLVLRADVVAHGQTYNGQAYWVECVFRERIEGPRTIAADETAAAPWGFFRGRGVLAPRARASYACRACPFPAIAPRVSSPRST